MINKQISHETLTSISGQTRKQGVGCLPFFDVNARLISRAASVWLDVVTSKTMSALKSGQILLMKNHALETGK